MEPVEPINTVVFIKTNYTILDSKFTEFTFNLFAEELFESTTGNNICCYVDKTDFTFRSVRKFSGSYKNLK